VVRAGLTAPVYELIGAVQMEEHYQCRPRAEPVNTPLPNAAPTASADPSLLSEYDKFCRSRLNQDNNEGWASELCHYLKDVPTDVIKETDIIMWWQVHCDNLFVNLHYW
jgi:hypothetical protein